FAESIVQPDLSTSPFYQKLSAPEQASTTAMAVSQFIASYTNRFKVEASSSTPAESVFYDTIVEMFRSLRDRLQGWFYALWGLILFLIVRGVGVILVWITQFLSLMVYEAMVASGFMKVVQHPATKETVEY